MTGPGRYHVTLLLAGRPTLHGWWDDEPTARRQTASLIGQYSQPGARVTLVDEETGAVLTTWPPEP
ncbi:hypothetical protein [Streptomyces sp. JB150]|uniref:hypothetical protein n=1 Tax=Streptomyces sp. JB150 TaxID=2714844 RepID=UPI001407A339|nr:hypothetical protein [Streptomyces sp. JB150]QIJ61390.1 hypothetical protein G7Z13_04575 [Streptomyces sp. JB150]